MEKEDALLMMAAAPGLGPPYLPPRKLRYGRITHPRTAENSKKTFSSRHYAVGMVCHTISIGGVFAGPHLAGV
jgi:hypothetical protein